MQSLIICSSPAESALAGEIRQYLGANCPSIDLQNDNIVPSADEVLDIVDHALSADLTLLLLSPEANPGVLSRAQWEPVLIDQPREMKTTLAFVLARPCRFPEILRKHRFFDLTVNRRDGLCKMRRWLLDQSPLKGERSEILPPRPRAAGIPPDIEAALDARIGDQPGTVFDVPADTALAFAHAHSRDFEGVFWIHCLGRSRAGIIGDTAHGLKLKLTGPTARNGRVLKEFCAQRRCLFIFDQLSREDRELVAFQGRASVIFTAAASGVQSGGLTLAETVALFSDWRNNAEPCLLRLRDAHRYLPEEKSLGALLFGLLRHQERLAEAYDVLEFLSKQAWEDGNAADLRRWEWEKSWIQESWGHIAPTPLCLGTSVEPAQLSLAF